MSRRINDNFRGERQEERLEESRDVNFPDFINPTTEQTDEEETSGRNRKQRHVHEFEGSTMLAENGEDRHNHRFAGVSGQAIEKCGSHIHEIETKTDFLDHFHLIKVKTGLAIPVGDGKHVHFVEGSTTVNDDHRHKFKFATLIETPLINED